MKNNCAPFLRGQMSFPGEITKEKSKPKKFDVRHGITHHDIYIQIRKTKKAHRDVESQIEWIHLKDLKKVNPSSLLSKVLKQVEK